MKLTRVLISLSEGGKLLAPLSVILNYLSTYHCHTGMSHSCHFNNHFRAQYLVLQRVGLRIFGVLLILGEFLYFETKLIQNSQYTDNENWTQLKALSGVDIGLNKGNNPWRVMISIAIHFNSRRYICKFSTVRTHIARPRIRALHLMVS